MSRTTTIRRRTPRIGDRFRRWTGVVMQAEKLNPEPAQTAAAGQPAAPLGLEPGALVAAAGGRWGVRQLTDTAVSLFDARIAGTRWAVRPGPLYRGWTP